MPDRGPDLQLLCQRSHASSRTAIGLGLLLSALANAAEPARSAEDHAREARLISGLITLSIEEPDVDALGRGDLFTARAHWLAPEWLAWPIDADEGDRFALHAHPEGAMQLQQTGLSAAETLALRLEPNGLPTELRAHFPHLAEATALRLEGVSPDRCGELLQGQLAISRQGPSGELLDATGLQIPGVLDALFATKHPLGAQWSDAGVPSLHVWAPTARNVSLLRFAQPHGDEVLQRLDMQREGGVWSIEGTPAWKDGYYLYEVELYVPSTGRIELNRVSDPYSRSLAANGARSQLIDIDDPSLFPDGWSDLRKPALDHIADSVIYELHVRDFSAWVEELEPALRGTFLAFVHDHAGTRHLRRLAEAGLTHVHLLPAFDFATVNEDRSSWVMPANLDGLPSDSDEQQERIGKTRHVDPYNWGYDPVHYGVPEGSYATNPDGPTRVLEFRQMVQALAEMGLRVVMDVVYNHTHASGQDRFSILDRIVPGYYHRLDENGRVCTSTCCANTASEHEMMRRLMVDDLVHWALDYRVDGFRFDLMGHHMRKDMEIARDALRGLQLETDGIEGPKILLYGEGWDFGEVVGGQRGINATQINMAGTGIATFNDRLRDAVRGGNPFDDRRRQGFATGLWTAPNPTGVADESARNQLLELCDRIRVGLSGNLAEFPLRDRHGIEIMGRDLPYGGYTSQPQEAISYVSAHDNETLFDKIVLAAPPELPMAERLRMQHLALGCVALSQGVPFFHAGSEMLRSKSLDADSYDSGDWFNRLDFSLRSNNFGAGLPPAWRNRDRWSLLRPFLAREDLRPGTRDIAHSLELFLELLRLRQSSPLFRLGNREEVVRRLRFLNTGPAQTPGLIVMMISDEGDGLEDLDPAVRRLLVVFNAAAREQVFRQPGLRGRAFELHPIQRNGKDDRARAARFDPQEGALAILARSVAVFVERD
jgi:pullulanase-type alpha-1,6-glucosidase